MWRAEKVKRERAFGVQTFLDVAQTLAPRQLRKAHADQLLSASKVPRANVVALGQTIQRLTMNQIQDLGDDVSSGVYVVLVLQTACDKLSALRSSSSTKVRRTLLQSLSRCTAVG